LNIRLRHILFAAFTLISIIPVIFLTVWVQKTAVEKEVQAVEEKHLLLARNLTQALSRYSLDVKESFRVVSDFHQANNEIAAPFDKFLNKLDIHVIAQINRKTQTVDILQGNSQAYQQIYLTTYKTI